MRRWHQGTAALATMVTALLVTCGTAKAQVKPFKVSGAGIVDNIPGPGQSANHWAIGNATYLGKYYGKGSVQLIDFTGLTTAEFKSAVPFVFTSADGDDLAFTYGVSPPAAQAGQVSLTLVGFTDDPVPVPLFVATWVAEFNPVPSQCTGRFKDVIDGSFIMTAVTEPFVLGAVNIAYAWEGDGSIEFARGGKK